jgi:hypothetical protein
MVDIPVPVDTAIRSAAPKDLEILTFYASSDRQNCWYDCTTTGMRFVANEPAREAKSHLIIYLPAGQDDEERGAYFFFSIEMMMFAGPAAIIIAFSLATMTAVQAQNPVCEICGCSYCAAGKFPMGNPTGTIPIPAEFASQAPPGTATAFSGPSGIVRNRTNRLFRVLTLLSSSYR